MAKKGRKKGISKWAALAAGFMAGVAAMLLFVKYSGYFGTALPPPPAVPHHVERATPPEAVKPTAPPETTPPVKTYPKVAIVIDDMGQDMRKLKELVDLNAPITVAVLPNLAHSKETASFAHQKGLEVLLHLPMEPRDSADNHPGKGALLVSMTPEEIRKNMAEDFKTVPYAIGVNNHMGSKFTEEEPQMRAVLGVVKNRNMFFLDSRTSSRSVAARIAKEMGVKNADRNVFLDNSRDVAYIKGQIKELEEIAKRHGTAIGIGHPHPETIEAIKESLGGLNGSVEIVKLSDIIGNREGKKGP